MIMINLMNELKAYFEKELKFNIGFQNEREEVVTPKVFLSYLPLKEVQMKGSEQETYPYVIIRMITAKEEDNHSLVKLKLILGIYRDDETGHTDLINLYEGVRKSLLIKQYFESARMKLPIEFKIPEDQALPYFNGEVNLQFELPTYQLEGVAEGWEQ